MDEFEPGQVYFIKGVPYRFNGGDPKVRENWTRTSGDPEAPRHSAIADAGRMAVHGASQGTSDEIAGMGIGNALRMLVSNLGIGSPARAAARAAAEITTPAGQDRLRGARERVAQARADHPAISVIAETAGGAAVPLGSGTGVARTVVGRTGSRLLGGAAGGAVGGATGGAVYGANEAPEGRRLQGGLVGGTVGGAAGAVLGGGTALGARAAGAGEGTEIARQYLTEHMGLAGLDPANILNDLRAMGPGSVAADLGENLGRSARAAINEVPEFAAPGALKDRIRVRNQGTGDRLADELRTTSGLSRTFAESLEEAQGAVREVRREFFQPLEAQFPTVEGERVLQAIVEDPRIMEVAERVAPGVSAGRYPSFRELQDIMMELRDDATAARAAGRPNRSREAGQSYDRIVEAMKADIPGFAEAQGAYRIASKTVEAHELGRRMARRPPREIADAMSQLPADAHDAFRQGILDVYETSLLERQGGGAAAGRIIEAGEAMRDRLRILTQDDPGFQRLMQSADREGRWRNTWRAISGNSTTAQQLTDAESIWSRIPTDKQGVFRSIVQWVQGSERERQAAWRLIGEVLLSDGETAARKLATELSLRAGISGPAGALFGQGAAQQSTQNQHPQGGLFR